MHADISSKMTERSREEGSIFHFPKKSCLSSNISFLCHANLFSTQWCTLRLTQGNIYIYFIFSWLTLYREGLNRQTESHVYIPLTLKVFLTRLNPECNAEGNSFRHVQVSKLTHEWVLRRSRKPSKSLKSQKYF